MGFCNLWWWNQTRILLKPQRISTLEFKISFTISNELLPYNSWLKWNLQGPFHCTYPDDQCVLPWSRESSQFHRSKLLHGMITSWCIAGTPRIRSFNWNACCLLLTSLDINITKEDSSKYNMLFSNYVLMPKPLSYIIADLIVIHWILAEEWWWRSIWCSRQSQW